MKNCVVLRHVCKQYEDFALQDISFTLPEGAIMGLIGENGAGKTTTFKCILGLLRPAGGEIDIFGKPFGQHREVCKSQMGVVLGESYFHACLTPLNIQLFMKPIFPNWDSLYYESLLRQFGLPETKAVGKFSKGMKMKLSIAVALAHHPRLLILDEPTSGLDLVARGELLDIFLEFIQREECSILFSSHITTDLEKIADYITYIHQGRQVFSAQKDELLECFGVLHCGGKDFLKIPRDAYLGCRQNLFGWEVLVKNRHQMAAAMPNCPVDPATLDDIMQLHGKGIESC